jgi:hypothetical protein
MIEPIRKILQTPFGLAECDARFWPSSPDLPLTYSCWLFETRENWVFPQSLIRATESMEGPTHGIHSEIKMSDELLRSYAPHIIRHKQSPFYEDAERIMNARC